MGRPEFSTPGTQGGGQSVSVMDRPEISMLESYNSTSLASGNKEMVEFFAPSGSVYEAVAMRLVCRPNGAATAGDHYFRVWTLGDVQITYGANGYSGQLLFNDGTWRSSSGNQPTTEAGLIAGVQSLRATENTPMRIEYENATDAAQTETREIQIVVEERSY